VRYFTALSQQIVTTVKCVADDILFYSTVCFVFVKQLATFKWEDIISVFPVLQGSAEALIGCDGQLYELNVPAEKYYNTTAHTRVTTKVLEIFLRQSVETY